MNEFADALRDRDILDATLLADFDHIQAECNKKAALLGVSARNLEQLASFLAVLDAASPHTPFRGCTKHRTPKRALELVIESMGKITLPKIAFSALDHMRALTNLARTTDLTIITTNYDIHVELSTLGRSDFAREVGIKLTPGLAQHVDVSLLESLYCSCCTYGLKLYKLHGSSNWFTYAGKLARVDYRVTCHAPRRGVQADHEYELRPEEKVDLSRPYKRLLIPPTVLKTQHMSVVSEQWRGAFDAISQADRLWFIGYSFPESDSYMQYFLAAAVADNTWLRQLAVIDPSDAVTTEKARRLFDVPRLREIFLPVQARFQDVRFSKILEDKPDEAMKLESGNINTRVMVLAERAARKIIRSRSLD